jgi:hypothetical protein
VDTSGFWAALVLPMFIYGGIYAATDLAGVNPRSGRVAFYWIAAIVNFVFIAFAISMLIKNEFMGGGLLMFIVGLVCSDILGYSLFRWAVNDRDAIELKKKQESERWQKLSQAEKKAEVELMKKKAIADQNREDLRFYGEVVAALVCPHCQTKGQVRRKDGLSDEQVLDKSNFYKQRKVLKMRCGNCQTKWEVS